MEELKAMAEAGDPVSQCKLAMAYLKGLGIGKDSKMALHWYQRAAEAGNCAAQYNLADMYMRGDGVVPDQAEALIWFKKAAEAGDLDAFYNLGLIYLGRGRGRTSVDVDEALSTECFLKAADGGLARAQYEAGVIYLHGRGLVADREKAKYWFERALENGVARALEQLEQLSLSES